MNKRSFIILNAYHILIDGLFDTVPVLLALIAIYYGGGSKEVGLAMSAALCVNTLASLGTLPFSRRFALEQGTALVAMLYGIGFFVCAFATSFWLAAICFTIAFTGHSIFHNIAFAGLTASTERGQLGRVMSDFIAIGDIGRIPLVSLAATLAAWSFAETPGWRVVCLFYGILAIIAGTLLFRHGTKHALQKETIVESHCESRTQKLPDLTLLRNPSTALSVIASAINSLSNDSVFIFLPLLLIAKGFDPDVIGSFAFAFTLGCFIGKMACGRLIDRFGTRKIFVASQILLAFFFIILLQNINLVGIIAVSLCIGIVTKGSVPIIQTIITEHIQNKNRYGDIFTINTFARGIIQMATPAIFGLIAAANGVESVYIIMLVAALVAVLPVFLLKAVQ